MKTPALILLLALHFSSAATPKNTDPLRKEIDSVNHYLAVYAQCNPFNFDSASNANMLTVQNEIITRLTGFLSNPNSRKYDLSAIFKGEELVHTASADGVVHFFSFDEKTGGTYRSFLTLMHTRSKDSLHVTLLNDEPYGHSCFYSVYPIDTLHHEYLALASVITCTTCEADFAVIVHAPERSTELLLTAECRLYNSDVMMFNSDSGTLSYSYFNRSDDPLFGAREYEEYVTIDYFSGTFTLLNGTFIETRKYWYSTPANNE